jgi:hypothetical protein
MVTVAGPRRIHTGFLFKCAVFGGWSPNRTPRRSIPSRWREVSRIGSRPKTADKAAAARMTL